MAGRNNDKPSKSQTKKTPRPVPVPGNAPDIEVVERHVLYSGDPKPAASWHKAQAIADPTGQRASRRFTIRIECDAGDAYWRKARIAKDKGSVPGIEWLCRGEASHVVAVVTYGP